MARRIQALFAFGMFASVASVSHGELLGGNETIDRPLVDVATSIIFFDLNSPVQTNGSISSWSIYASGQQSGIGQLKLKIFRDIGSEWEFVGQSPLETVSSWGAVNTFTLPSPIAVQAGDMISWWYPAGTVPSVAYSREGQTLNNGDWPLMPDVDFTSNIPDLLDDPSWGGHGWGVNTRTYSIKVEGIPEPSSFLIALIGLRELVSVRQYCRRRPPPGRSSVTGRRSRCPLH